MMLMATWQGLLGLAAFPLIAWLLGEHRHMRVPWRIVVSAFVLQGVFALLLLRIPGSATLLLGLNRVALTLQEATDAGTGFMFGYLGGGPLPFAETTPGASFILAFKVLPLVLVISALSALLYYWGVLQLVARVLALLLRRVMGISGALALAAATHIYVGMIEAPLLIRPYLAGMQRGELFAVMTCGMAGIAGTMMVLYASLIGPVLPGALGHILVASVISTPAALGMAALMVPFDAADDRGREKGLGAALSVEQAPAGALDALVKGTRDGIAPLIGILTVLIVAVALVHLVNDALFLMPGSPSLQELAAWPFRPLMWLAGIPSDQVGPAAGLMGQKTIINEFVAYNGLAHLPAGTLDAHARLIVTYALCGFANLGSAGILIGGMGAMVPERRAEIAALGLRSVLSGTLATCMSGAVAGLLME
ncbi:Nucleoside permease nupC [Granulibacter bethesdensis]|uniref:Nucleoside permease nupC n=3 Tax=Granulibacter bethesdensis TaxID=364410 RepID=A0AAC9KAH9_9PROT|nr:Nucleoside permease nupC [Granulibacter bethesdensis]APH61696.1 Nucleoside permease nupC [Granulibacter bethesdensis]